jgi:replicative DNA helicase
LEYTRRTINRDDEINIVTGLIVNTDFAKQIQPLFKTEYFSIPYARTVSLWALDYFSKYDKAPGSDIASIFESEKQNIRDDSQVELISNFLHNLNDKYIESETFNVQYALDNAIKYFRFQAVDILTDKIKTAKLSGNVEEAEALISNFKRLEKGSGTATSVWTDEEEAVKAIRGEDEKDYLIKFPGELGKMIRPLRSEDFVAFIAPPKRGKSFWLVELAVLASLSRKNVLFVTLEMPASQLRLRILQRITGMVCDPYSNGEPCEVSIPAFDHNFAINGVVNRKKEMREQITARAALKKMREVHSFVKSDNFRIIAAPANSMTDQDLERDLDNLEHYENFIPDIVLLDYCDIMAANRKSDHRNQINDKWEGTRRIGQDRSMMMATVSHTNKETLYRDVRESDVVEDVRKLNHITMCIGVNQLQMDKDLGVQRLSVLNDRFAEFNATKEAVVTQCLSIGGVYLDSRIRYKGGKGE